jgi:twinkle protein
MDEDDYNGQKKFLDELTAIARDKQIHIHLICHSRKLADENSPPGKMDLKGSGSITDQADNCVTVWRNKKKEALAAQGKADEKAPDNLLIIDKQRNGEWEGQIALWWHRASGQYVAAPNGHPLSLMEWKA